MTSDMVCSLVGALWPYYGDGDEVRIERLSRDASCPVAAMVMYDENEERWRVFVDKELAGKRLLVTLAHELGHVHYGDVDKSGDGDAARVNKSVFTGARTLESGFSRLGWVAQGRKSETWVEESRVNKFAVEFARTWLGPLGHMERVFYYAVRKAIRQQEV